LAKPQFYRPMRAITCRFYIGLMALLGCILIHSTDGFGQSPTPRLTNIEPISGMQATTLTLLLNGSGFTQASKVAFSDAGIIVQSIRFVSSRTLEATVVLSARANQYSVFVSNGGALSNGQRFSIVPTPTSNAPQLQVAAMGGSGSAWMDPYHVWVSGNHGFVTDYANSVVRVISLSNGTTSTLAGKEGDFGNQDGVGAAARFGQPAGVWSNGTHVYVSDTYFDTIRRISLSTGSVDTLAGSAANASGAIDGFGSSARFRAPGGIWGDGTSLYVCDTLNFTLRKVVLATGQVTTLAGRSRVRGHSDGVGAQAQFYAPQDVWGDGTYLYVADGGSIRKVAIATGEVTTLTGKTESGGFSDGSSSQALFGFISGIWGDGENLFVADSGNNAIRKVSLTGGSVTTLAGGPTNGNIDGLGRTAHFDNPTGIAGDGNTLLIVDRMNSNLRRGLASFDVSAESAAPRIATGRGAIEISATTNDVSRFGFELQSRGGTTRTTTGKSTNVQTGYGKLSVRTGGSAPAGLAIVGYERNRVLVSETSVAASGLIRAGIIPTEMRGGVNTGMAVANPNDEDVTLTFSFKDDAGNPVHSGTIKIQARGMITGFLNERPYAPPRGTGFDLSNAKTFSFTASEPIGVTALRGHTNARSDFLASTLPVTVPGLVSSSPLIFPHYANGGGWRSQIVLVNPTNARISGTAAVFSGEGGAAIRNIPYTIAQGSSTTLELSLGNDPRARTGWIRVSPTGGDPSPSGFVLFSLESNGSILTEGAITPTAAAPVARLFVETSGDFGRRERRSIRTSFALSNPNNSAATVEFELFGLDGASTGMRTSITVAPNEQLSLFVEQLPGFEDLPVPFQGFLRVSGITTAIVGLRARYNERGDMLITATPAVPEGGQVLAQGQSLFPFVVDGGGYTTQFVLLNSNGEESINGVLDFVQPSGEPLPLVIQ
jgi:hypothetical protein